MRRKIIILAALVVIAVFLLPGCTGFNSRDTVTEGSCEYYISSIGTRAFPFEYRWDGDTKNTLIEIPDKVGRASVESVGGYYGTGVPTPFMITTLEEFSSEEASVPYGAQAEPLVFTLSLGKNIRNIVDVIAPEYLPSRAIDGSIHWYAPQIRVELREENSHYYVRDYKLYRHEDDTLVDVIDYGDRSEEKAVEFKSGTLRTYGTMAYVTEYEWVKTLTGAVLTKYEGAWQYDDDLDRNDCIAAEVEGGEEFYQELCRLLGEKQITAWEGFNGTNPGVLDGGGFSLSMQLSNGITVSARGENSYPDGYQSFVSALETILERSNDT